jgi:conjugative transfer signal peptidase TraF
MAAATAIVVVSAACHPAPKLIWNASASVPVGLYALQAFSVPRAGELVVVKPPNPLAGFLDDRRYLPRGVPLVKPIAALPGQRVCRIGRAVTVDGRALGEALGRDRRGRALPAWRGCRRVAAGEVFLMNPRSTDSLDGRYFGTLPVTTIIGRATPIWTEATR